MKEYMKMSDFISGLVSNHDGELLDDRGFVAACDGSTSGKGDYIAHAINNHDELVAEVERLRLMISECYPYIKDKADWGNEYEVDLADRLFDAAM